jgi:outer membrane receptor protein involved in Fe transport
MMAAAPWVVAADEGPAAPATASTTPPILEEVTVTGSRIKRRDLESSSPLVTVDSEALESKSGLNIESYLNQLPNYNPATTPTGGGQLDVQASAINSIGVSTISLRGFGCNRSLTLVDGHRATPVNALMCVDINSIPSSMIERIDIITGGASAVYGADAMGGVTNFILKKNFQGLELDVQDGITQAGDGNELRASALMGTKIADGRGNIMGGMEYYERQAAYQRNRDFFTKAWSDPNVPTADLFVFGYNGYDTGLAPPSNAALSALFPARGASATGTPYVFGYGSGGVIQGLRFNSNGTLWDPVGPLGSSGFTGPTSGSGYGLVNVFDSTYQNAAGSVPPVTQNLKWNNPNGYASEPQTRYSFFTNGTFDITDKVQFFANARFAQSLTRTFLIPSNASFGWEASVPYNAKTDSPIDPAAVSPTTDAATLTKIAQLFAANPTPSNPYWNKNFIPTGTKGAQHPVPWQLALALNTRNAPFPGAGTFFGGPVPCNNSIAPSLCTQAPTSWIAETYPLNSFASRNTVDTTTSWQIETGLRFPIISDWTGEVYYSRGQSAENNLAYGNDSLQRWRAVIAAPDYGRGASFQGNYNGASTNFGTSVPSTCTSGYYNTLFAADATPSQDCLNAVTAQLQTQTNMQQDVVEANFNGSLFKWWAGDVSAALGYQYRRVAGQFVPDGLQSTNSFLDQVIGVYPTGALNSEVSVKDGYAELLLPLLRDLPMVKKLEFDVGGRYSAYDKTANTTTFKINANWDVTRSIRFRGGFNRATRAPNLGELFLNEQEFFGGGATFGDPCSVRSRAPFGAGGAAPDITASAGAGPTQLAAGQTAAGAQSAYLICQALMGATGAQQYYGAPPSATNPQGAAGSNQATAANAALFAWVNQEGNPNLRSETADTWTGGIVLSDLGDSPWIKGFSASVDYWRVNITNAIELSSPDYANYLCYGTTTVTNAAQAAAQAASPACQNVARNQSSGGQTTALLQFTNLATIATSGVDLELNWLWRLSDLGLSHVPGAFSINEEASWLNYYYTKASPLSFDVKTNWKGSLGPTLSGTNPGAYTYRLYTTFGYVLPSFNVNFRWRFLPSVNSARHATNQSIIDNNNSGGPILSYTPDTDLAAPHYNVLDMSFNWNVTSILQVRGGINNLFNVEPAITGAVRGWPANTDLNNVCSAAAKAKGCVNPTTYGYVTGLGPNTVTNDGQGVTNGGFYDVYGRTFWLGVKARF